MTYHFGVKVHEGKRGLKLTREKYAVVSNKSSFGNNKVYDEEWCEKQLKRSMENFDLNIEYLSLLDRNEFREGIEKFLEMNTQFIEVFDLNLYDGKSGYYLMVLDEYSQVYIGTSSNIKRRIRQHWSSSKSFDRLIFGNVNTSKLSIDSFRALDTTRIYAYVTTQIFNIEDNFINQFPDIFVCNRTIGGEMPGGLLQAISMGKKRNLTR
ncbi:GIY-YIG nuclease family protein [Solibacillus sp. FSL W8-0372]|uniref:GIY-YIG nuclease family protein n=1 Tax=Solibacillus sp. FSL W8-0372 TaxID=2921713 RepID=UPI0030D2F6C8